MRRITIHAIALAACLAGAAPATAAWQPAETVAANPLDDIDDAHAVGGASGEIVVTWETSGHRYLRVRAADGSWSSPTDLGGTTGGSALAADAAGNALAVWTASNGDVMVLRRAASGSTPAPTVVAHGSSGDVAAAIDGPTAVVVAGGTVRRSGDAGATWTSAAIGAGDDAVAAVRDGGEALVVWASGGRVRAATWPAGGTLGPSVALSAAATQASAPDVAVDADGDALAAWVESAGGYGAPVRVAARPAGGAWSASMAAGGNTLTETGPDVAVTPAGHAFVAWHAIYDGIGSGYTFGSGMVADGTIAPLALGAPAAFGGSARTLALTADAAGALAASGSETSPGLPAVRIGPSGTAATTERVVCPPTYTNPRSVVRAGATSAVLWTQANIVLDRYALKLSTDAGSPGSMAGDCAERRATIVQTPSPVPVGQPVHLQLIDGVDPEAAHTAIFWELDGDFSSTAGGGVPTGASPAIDAVLSTPGLIASTVEVESENSFGRGRGTTIPFWVSVCAVCPAPVGGGAGGGGGGGGAPVTAPPAPNPSPALTPSPTAPPLLTPPPAATVAPAASATALTVDVPRGFALSGVRRHGVRVAIGTGHTTRLRVEVRFGGAVVGVRRLRVPARTTRTATVALTRAARERLRHGSVLLVRLVPAAHSQLRAVERRVRVR